ncbi:unnamed protein product [Polarella glacialis]|uniref:Uncharacterized protein n=1 Tax=Polarella glacialis TaxID=89957 RepID=A0A813HUN3_POLGL|nr:unnamed protein product [Polarella glacialis]
MMRQSCFGKPRIFDVGVVGVVVLLLLLLPLLPLLPLLLVSRVTRWLAHLANSHRVSELFMVGLLLLLSFFFLFLLLLLLCVSMLVHNIISSGYIGRCFYHRYVIPLVSLSEAQ